jgi:flagellar motor switch protein FliN/FliY
MDMSENINANEVQAFEKKCEEMQHFLDVPLKITIQLASCNMKIREILQLQQESIIELPKSAGENVDVLVNERLIGFGEVLELEGSTGIRITDLNNQI